MIMTRPNQSRSIELSIPPMWLWLSMWLSVAIRSGRAYAAQRNAME
jgi:hypothetical protein